MGASPDTGQRGAHADSACAIRWAPAGKPVRTLEPDCLPPMFPFRSGPSALAVLSCLSGAAPLLAPTSTQAQGAGDAQRVVVTAARAEQAWPDALPSTRVITRTEIDAAQATDLPALLRALTSIDIAQSGPLGSQASLFLRGADSRQVLVLIDGVPFARADTGSSSWQYLPLEQVERIEIVRGNLSSLYGAQAVGGVVQIVTRQASAPAATLALGSQGTHRAGLAAGTRWGSDGQGTRLAASLSAQRTDGFSARDPAGDTSVNPDRDGARQDGLNLRIEQDWTPGHRTRLALTASRTRSDYDGFDPAARDVLTTRVQAMALTTRHALASGWSLHAEAGQTRERFDDPTGFTPRGDGRVRNVAATLGWAIAPQQELQFGFESRHDRFDVPGSSDQERSTDSARLAWLGRWHDGWQVQAHLRHDRSSDFGSATTGMFALGWTIAPAWKASASISTGFSAPSFTEQAFDTDPGTPLRAERSRQAELALQWREGAASTRGALFVQRQRDRIQFDPITFDATNIARARNQGLELLAQLPLPVGVLHGELTLQDPRNADDGTPLLRRAKQALSMGWQGRFENWDLRASARYTGARADFDPVSFATATNRSRTTLALGVARELSPQWRASLAIDNALDTRRPEVLGYTAPPRSVLLSLQGTLR